MCKAIKSLGQKEKENTVKLPRKYLLSSTTEMKSQPGIWWLGSLMESITTLASPSNWTNLQPKLTN